MKALYQITIAFLIGLVFASCSARGELGSGKLVKEARQTTSFQSVQVNGSFEVFLKQGPQESVFIEADDNLLKSISSTVTNGVLKIETKDGIKPSKRVKVLVTVAQLNQIEGNGAVVFRTDGTLYLNDLKIDGSGSSEIAINLVCKSIQCDFSGSCELKATGKADKASYTISGGGSISAVDFVVNDCVIEVSGASDAMIHATKSLDVTISGAGKVLYKGNPTISQSISGAGQIRSL